jgi:hypothetical protein
MGFVEAFVGAPQSKLSGIAILVAIIAVFISILFSKDGMAVTQKVGMAFIFLLICIPIALYNLFQITCIVTGSGVNWWCGLYAWAITVIILIFVAILIVAAIYVMVSNKPKDENFRGVGGRGRSSGPVYAPNATVPLNKKRRP